MTSSSYNIFASLPCFITDAAISARYVSLRYAFDATLFHTLCLRCRHAADATPPAAVMLRLRCHYAMIFFRHDCHYAAMRHMAADMLSPCRQRFSGCQIFAAMTCHCFYDYCHYAALPLFVAIEAVYAATPLLMPDCCSYYARRSLRHGVIRRQWHSAAMPRIYELLALYGAICLLYILALRYFATLPLAARYMMLLIFSRRHDACWLCHCCFMPLFRHAAIFSRRCRCCRRRLLLDAACQLRYDAITP